MPDAEKTLAKVSELIGYTGDDLIGAMEGYVENYEYMEDLIKRTCADDIMLDDEED